MSGDGVQTFRVSATAYDGHVGRYGTELARGLIGLAGIIVGDRVLEVGAGTGLLTAELAATVGPSGSVTAVEPSEPFAQASRARVPSADVRAGRGEELPFADRRFDGVLSQLVLNFLSEPQAGVREMCRVACDGAVVAASVWDYSGEMTLLRRFWDAAVATDPGAAALDEGVIMRNCDPASLHSLWSGAGLREVTVAELWPAVHYADFDELWAPFTQGVAPSGAYTASLDPDRQDRLRAEYFRRLDSPASEFTVTARAWAVTGRR